MAPPELRYPPKPRPGDRVAIVSPSFAGPARFPAIHELGLRRLREDIGLEPVEYPTTRRLRASAGDRAADLVAAFADPSITAILATIGGDDQLTVLGMLDRLPARCRRRVRGRDRPHRPAVDHSVRGLDVRGRAYTHHSRPVLSLRQSRRG